MIEDTSASDRLVPELRTYFDIEWTANVRLFEAGEIPLLPKFG